MDTNQARFTGVIRDIHASGDTVWVVDENSLFKFVVNSEADMQLVRQIRADAGVVSIHDLGDKLLVIPPLKRTPVTRFELCTATDTYSVEADSLSHPYPISFVQSFGDAAVVSINNLLYQVDFKTRIVQQTVLPTIVNVLHVEADTTLYCGLRDRGYYMFDSDLSLQDSFLIHFPASSISHTYDGTVWSTSHLEGLMCIPDKSSRFLPGNGIVAPVIGSVMSSRGLIYVDYEGDVWRIANGREEPSLILENSLSMTVYSVFEDSVSDALIVRHRNEYHSLKVNRTGVDFTLGEQIAGGNKFDSESNWFATGRDTLKYIQRHADGRHQTTHTLSGIKGQARHLIRFSDSCSVLSLKTGVFLAELTYDGLTWTEIDFPKGPVTVTSMQQTGPREVTFSTLDHGIWKLVNKREAVQLVTAEQLMGDRPQSCLRTNEKLYIGTQDGLWVYAPREERIEKHWISGVKGLSPLAVNHIAVIDNYVFIASDRGYFMLEPDKEKKVHEIQQSIGLLAQGAFERIDGSEVTFDANVSDITLRISNNSYINPQVRSYRYRLDPVQTEWVSSSTGRLEFNALRPGEYTLYYQSEISKDNWFGQEPGRLSIVVNSPFWATWWFYTLGALMAIGFIWLLVVNRIHAAKARKKTKFHALKAQSEALALQLNPHFLFNSFNSTIAYIGSAGNKESIEMLSKLSRLMRKVFHVSEQAFHPLSHEIELVREYLQIEELRFNQSMLFHIDTESHVDMEAVHIPVLLLQPIIENSVKHGFAQKNRVLEIDVSISKQEECLVIEITDNGLGLNEDLQGEDKRFSSVVAITKRFKILSELSNKAYSMHMRNSAKQGVITTLRMPYFSNEESTGVK